MLIKAHIRTPNCVWSKAVMLKTCSEVQLHFFFACSKFTTVGINGKKVGFHPHEEVVTESNLAM